MYTIFFMLTPSLFLLSHVLIDPSFVTVTDKSTSTVLFFTSSPFSFLHSRSFTIYYKCVTASRRLERGEQCVVTLSAALQLSAWFQLLLPAGRGGPGCRPSTRLPLHPSTPPPLHHHQNQSLCDTLQTIHWSPCITVQCTTNNGQQCGSGLQEQKRWRVITGKYEMWNGRGRGKGKESTVMEEIIV